MSKIMTKTDVQRMLHISDLTVNKLVKEGTLVMYCFPNSRRTYFLEEEVVEALTKERGGDHERVDSN